MMLKPMLFGLALACAGAHAQISASSPYPYPAPLAPQYSPPTYDHDALAKAQKCMRGYAMRFASTTALPQDVADAALEACEHERFLAGVARAHGYANTVDLNTLRADEPDLRRAAIQALLEARFPKTH